MNDNANVVTCFMWYVFNAWNKKEALSLFGENLGKHIFDKWLYYKVNNLGELSWYSELDSHCREIIVERAKELYYKPNK